MTDLTPITLSVASFAEIATGSEGKAAATRLLSQRIAQVESAHQEKARCARRFCGGIQAVTNGIVPVVDLPTTTAPLLLYNAAPDGGKSLVIDHVAGAVASGTAGAGGSVLFCGVTAAKVATALTANGTGCSIQATRGAGSSVAFIDVAKTVPAGTAYVLLSSMMHTAIAVPGVGPSYRCDGSFVIPPGFGFVVGMFAHTGTTAKHLFSIIWDEMLIDLP